MARPVRASHEPAASARRQVLEKRQDSILNIDGIGWCRLQIDRRDGRRAAIDVAPEGLVDDPALDKHIDDCGAERLVKPAGEQGVGVRGIGWFRLSGHRRKSFWSVCRGILRADCRTVILIGRLRIVIAPLPAAKSKKREAA
tara:strand:+ start:4354 stop:4779 length:426 start_codon:yes stop_codon:yes gene_type:complete